MMQSIQSIPGVVANEIPNAADIPSLTHAEAGQLIREELTRFIRLAESLAGADWEQPTYCTDWTVRDILAHQAGAYAGYSSWAAFRRQYITNPYMRTEKEQVDGINRCQIEDRANHTTAELIAELREVGPKAINTRQKLPRLLRILPIMPMGPPKGTTPISYLTDDIYPRDTWSHRLDICAATGREMLITPEHDGRLTALIVQDLASTLGPQLGSQAVIYKISGPAGGIWQIGSGPAEAEISMAFQDFHLLASGRVSLELALEKMITITGDVGLAQKAVQNTVVLY